MQENSKAVMGRGGCLGLVVLAAGLHCGLHPVQADALVHQQLFSVAYCLLRQEAWASQDPGIVDVEDPQDVGAGVHDSHAGVVGGQNPVRAVGSDWEMEREKRL